MAKQLNFKDGDKVVFARSAKNRDAEGITIGKIYNVFMQYGSPTFLDDDGDARSSPLEAYCDMKPTKIVN